MHVRLLYLVAVLKRRPQGLSAFYAGAPPREEAFKVLDYAADSGCTFWDTSDIYGESEDLLGDWYVILVERLLDLLLISESMCHF
jgi:hypothetical protein